jgi:hypothetical protein
MPPQAVQPVSKGMIERILDNLNVHYRRDNEDDILAIFPFGPNGTDLHCWFLITGEKRDIFKFFCVTPITISSDKLPEAVTVCNFYHSQNRFGRAIVEVGTRSGEYRVNFDAQIDIEKGTSEEFLQRFILMNIYAVK